MSIDTSSSATIQRSLRQCISNMAALLFHNGHVLETVSVPYRGLDRDAIRHLNQVESEWSLCQRVLEQSEAASYNEYGRLVLTPMGRELLFDMFGEGAADCA